MAWQKFNTGSFKKMRGLNADVFLSLQWLSLVSERRVRPVNEIKQKWWVFFWRKDLTLVVRIVFRLGWVESWILSWKLSLWTALLKAWYKDNLSGHFLCAKIFWGNFQAPPQTRFGFLMTVPFSLLQLHFCDTLHVFRSENQTKRQTCGHTILNYQEKRQVNTRVKGISHIYKKALNHLWDRGLIRVT